MAKEKGKLAKYLSNFQERRKDCRDSSYIQFLEEEVKTTYGIIVDWENKYEKFLNRKEELEKTRK